MPFQVLGLPRRDRYPTRDRSHGAGIHVPEDHLATRVQAFPQSIQVRVQLWLIYLILSRLKFTHAWRKMPRGRH